MILLSHMIFGAAISRLVPNIFLAVSAAFLSHFLLDFIPHCEYGINNLKEKRWMKSKDDILKVSADLMTGTALILSFSGTKPAMLICAFFAILPDLISFIGYFLNNKFFEIYSDLHSKKIHYFQNPPGNGKKISNLWRILSQFLIVVLSLFILRF